MATKTNKLFVHHLTQDRIIMPISKTTWELLYATKQKDFTYDFKGVVSILGPIYHYDMLLMDVMSILLQSLDEVIAEPRFEVHPDLKNRIILEPLKNSFYESVETVWDVYNNMIKEILSNFGITRSSWCLDELKAIGEVRVNGQVQ
jgi:hypothetical protein